MKLEAKQTRNKNKIKKLIYIYDVIKQKILEKC